MQKFVTYLVLMMLLSDFSAAQNILPLHRHRTVAAEKLMAEDSVTSHTALKPFVYKDSSTMQKKLFSREDSTASWFLRKLRYENLIMIKKPQYRFTADPVLHFEISKNHEINERFYRNTRGFYITGNFENKVAFYTILYENQVAFQPHINNFIEEADVIPFAANYKPYEAPLSSLYQNGYDFTMAEGVVSWNALHMLNIQMGQGNHFVGEGYRSLLLSDRTYSYPYIKATLTKGKIQYTGMFAQMMDFDLPNTAESGYHKKHYNMHYLSVQITNWLQMGLFESVMYNPEDSTGYTNFRFNYINPILFSRSIEYGLGTKNNAMIGLNWRMDLMPKLQLYGQFLMDEFGKNGAENFDAADNKTGFQAGIKWFDALRIQNLYLQGSYNRVRPFTYTHQKARDNYTHARQPIAHPLGENFEEFTGIIKFQYKDFQMKVQGHIARQGVLKDQTLQYHNGLLNSAPSDSTNVALMGNEIQKSVYGRMQISYLLNPRTDMRLYAGIATQEKSNANHRDDNIFIFFGLRTFFSNRLFDF